MDEIDVKIGVGDYFQLIFMVAIGTVLVLMGIFSFNIVFVAPGVALLVYVYGEYRKTEQYFTELDEEIEKMSREIEGCLHKRIELLEMGVKIIERKEKIQKDLLVDIINLRLEMGELERGRLNEHIEKVAMELNSFLADFDRLRGEGQIIEMIQKNAYVQREMAEIRDAYNEKVYLWNRELFELPFRKIIAARRGYRTRKTFVASKLLKEGEKGYFF